MISSSPQPSKTNGAAERARRSEILREARAAALNHISPEEHAQKRETKADAWSRWFHDKMDDSGRTDPVTLLPDAFARLEQIAEDRAAAVVHEIKAALMEALK